MELASTKILDRAVVRAAIEQNRKHAAPTLQRVVDEGIATFERCSASAIGGDENLAVLFPPLHVFEKGRRGNAISMTFAPHRSADSRKFREAFRGEDPT
jgi:hypothetical protein